MDKSPGFLEEILKVGEITLLSLFQYPFAKEDADCLFHCRVKGSSHYMLTLIQGRFFKFVFLYNINPGPWGEKTVFVS